MSTNKAVIFNICFYLCLQGLVPPASSVGLWTAGQHSKAMTACKSVPELRQWYTVHCLQSCKMSNNVCFLNLEVQWSLRKPRQSFKWKAPSTSLEPKLQHDSSKLQELEWFSGQMVFFDSRRPQTRFSSWITYQEPSCHKNMTQVVLLRWTHTEFIIPVVGYSKLWEAGARLLA